MRRVAVVFAFTLVAVGLGGSARESAAVIQTPSKASAVLALVEVYNGSQLVWLDPATLRPLVKESVPLPGGAWSPVFSPAGRYVALGGPGSAGIRIVDLRRMKLTARVAARRYSNRRLVPVAWPDRRRLLVLDSPQDAQGETDALLAIDPVERRVVGRTVRASSAKVWRAWAPAGRELVALSQPTEGMGVVRLVVFGPGGGILRATDVGIVAGVGEDHGGNGPPRARVASPALAVDPAGRRAFVIDPLTVAQVDLDTLETSYARLAGSRSFASRFLAWLDPAAHAKLVSGFSRQATWLGDGSLAVSGASYEGTRSTPSGLQLVDTQTGAVRTPESRASSHRYSQGLLLAFGAGRDAQTNVWAGMGLAAFNPDGTKLWSALDEEPVGWVETACGYAYVPTPEEAFPQGVRVIDLATGSVIRTVRRQLPTFLARS